MMPVLRRTWAPCGATPTVSVRTRSHEKVLRDWRADRVAPPPAHHLGAGAASPTQHSRSRGAAVPSPSRPSRARALRPALGSRTLSHNHALVRTWLAAHRRCHIVWFPPYAPDLNPVELLWSYLKYGRRANFAPDTTRDIQIAVTRERRRVARRPELLRSFFRHSALPCHV